MKYGSLLLVPMLANLIATSLRAEPAQVTWEWFHAGETYKAYPNRSRNDLLMAAHFHRLAAGKGNSASAYKLAEMYENGVGVGQNYETALRWYRVSAELGDRYGQYRVGWFYQNGLGTARDLALAVHWYSLSSAQDNEWAHQSLGFLYADGEGVAKDAAKARHFFELAIPRTGDHWAKFKLATLIAESDPNRARLLLRQAADAGNPQAPKLLKAKGW